MDSRNEAGVRYDIEHDAFRYFFNPVSARHTYLSDVEALSVPVELSTPHTALERNLAAVRDVVSIPFAVQFVASRTGILRDLFQSWQSSNPGLPDDQGVARATQRWEERLADAKVQKAFVTEVLDHLVAMRQANEVQHTFNSLLRQGAVMTWTALEVVAQDVWRSVRTSFPGRTAVVKRSTDAARSPMDDIGTIREIYGALFNGKAELQGALAEARLDHLYLLRNLIVHRGARVDQKFIEETDDKSLNLGDEVEVTPALLEVLLHATSKAGVHLLLSARDLYGFEIGKA